MTTYFGPITINDIIWNTNDGSISNRNDYEELREIVLKLREIEGITVDDSKCEWLSGDPVNGTIKRWCFRISVTTHKDLINEDLEAWTELTMRIDQLVYPQMKPTKHHY